MWYLSGPRLESLTTGLRFRNQLADIQMRNSRATTIKKRQEKHGIMYNQLYKEYDNNKINVHKGDKKQ